jgi:hypothetical protein
MDPGVIGAGGGEVLALFLAIDACCAYENSVGALEAKSEKTIIRTMCEAPATEGNQEVKG